MIPYVDEPLETLYEKNRLLLVARKDFTNDAALGEYYKQNIVLASVTVFDFYEFQGRKLMVTFDIETLRENEIQLFVGEELEETIYVNRRCKRAVLVDIPDFAELYFFLRPVHKELYIHGIEIDLY
jgi:hypothetical protein